jgi:hypothetical protein
VLNRFSCLRNNKCLALIAQELLPDFIIPAIATIYVVESHMCI